MTDGEMCWEKESSEKKLSVSNSLNQSADLSQTDNRSDEGNQELLNISRLSVFSPWKESEVLGF